MWGFSINGFDPEEFFFHTVRTSIVSSINITVRKQHKFSCIYAYSRDFYMPSKYFHFKLELLLIMYYS